LLEIQFYYGENKNHWYYLISKEPLNNRLVEKAKHPELQNVIAFQKPITILY